MAMAPKSERGNAAKDVCVIKKVANKRLKPWHADERRFVDKNYQISTSNIHGLYSTCTEINSSSIKIFTFSPKKQLLL